MSLHQAAQHLASRGRGEDSLLIHMTPKEVSGLQALAQAHGKSLTFNPDTGLPEAGILSSILPMVIPIVSAAAAERLALRLRLPLPDRFAATLASEGESGGWTLFSQTLRSLGESGVADGLALMTQEMDPPAAFAERIRLALHQSGWA